MNGPYFECSSCGYEEEWELGDDIQRYCPECGETTDIVTDFGPIAADEQFSRLA